MRSNDPAGGSADHRQPNSISSSRSVIASMYAGLALTVVAMLFPYFDRAALTGHIRAGYPDYTAARIDAAAAAYLVYLSVVGVVGVAGWLWSVRAVKRRKRWAAIIATVMFALGATVALTDLLIKDTSGDTGLPRQLGLLGLLPCLPGLLAVTLMWRRP
jgi:cytochrome bd-type quinol oxidase subunit 2